jgi:hypothetical protein
MADCPHGCGNVWRGWGKSRGRFNAVLVRSFLPRAGICCVYISTKTTPSRVTACFIFRRRLYSSELDLTKDTTHLSGTTSLNLFVSQPEVRASAETLRITGASSRNALPAPPFVGRAGREEKAGIGNIGHLTSICAGGSQPGTTDFARNVFGSPNEILTSNLLVNSYVFETLGLTR